MRKTQITGALLIAVLFVLGACAPTSEETPLLSPNEVELKYDDGESDGNCSSGYQGFLAHFSPSVVPLTISKVRVFTNLHGTGYEERKPRLEIWDKDFNMQYICEEPYTSFSSKPSWVSIQIPTVTVDNDFYIVFYTNSRREGGVYMHYDTSVRNEHSEMAADGKVKDWGGWQQTPKEWTNWMIRVIGTPEALDQGDEVDKSDNNKG